ncbi:hypothetical protein ACFJGX_04240 [Hydrogenophaga sp. UC242_50]|uniref:hypothetical protein n=1 Tax=Hydrogenophaga sp. UC242_50 TaxID=3350169 RepID=UPI0036D2749E
MADEVAADDAAGARAVLHHEGLSHLLGEALREHARHQIDRAAGHVGHDDAHRAVRVGLGVRREAGGGEQAGQQRADPWVLHRRVSLKGGCGD